MKVLFNYKSPFNAALVFRQYDTINLPLYAVYIDKITGIETAFDFTGFEALAQFRRLDGILIKELRSDVSPAQIVITGNLLLLCNENFDTIELMSYDIKIFNSTEQYRIGYGYSKVEKSTTM